MPVYSLNPMDLTYKGWEGCRHRGTCIVRADTPVKAREIAKRAFWKGTDLPGIAVPWTQDTLVKVTLHINHDFQEDGPEEILDPPHYNTDWCWI